MMKLGIPPVTYVARVAVTLVQKSESLEQELESSSKGTL